MKIEDNFLKQKDFDELQTLMMGEEFSWYYNDKIDYKEDQHEMYFQQWLVFS